MQYFVPAVAGPIGVIHKSPSAGSIDNWFDRRDCRRLRELGNIRITGDVPPSIFDNRPLFPFISTTPRAGLALVRRLSCILRTDLGRRLSRETLEDVQARLLFVAPTVPGMGASSTPLTFASEEEEATFAWQLKEVWAFKTCAHQSIYKLRTEWEGTDNEVVIPGWVRERTAEVLFENDEDAKGIAECLLETFLKVGAGRRIWGNAFSEKVRGLRAHTSQAKQ
ncbi:MAG: hypothetical protein BJ554DRAFT_6253 [Olpidium bornovanus]|uniref:Uncharacterized protein n=1 Tax=Olpidium bornovanus TaxID=278681 RepID=A0A8H7ZY91_9FUNG|nr:MAG: hypothetical protein BJ554DRAFT_6253 [Olpidium bornovanus]